MKSYFTTFILIIFITISIFSSSFTQIDWTKDTLNNPVLSPVSLSNWEDWSVYAPCVLKHEDTLKMWYTGTKSGGVQQIGYATSTNGINWQRDPHNPVLTVGPAGTWDAEYVGHPEIILVDTTYHMWYAGTNFSNISARIGYATSPDGINWTKYDDPSTTNPPYAQSDPVLTPGPPGSWDSAALAGHFIFFDGDTFHVWYGGCDSLLNRRYRIGYAESPDGINWTKDTLNNPVYYGLAGSWDSVSVATPCVMVDSSGYKMWYHGYDSSHWRIGYATSSDGITWVPLDTPVLNIGDPGTWDDKNIYNPHVLLDGTTYRMWYAGIDYVTQNSGEHIGYATAPVVGIKAYDNTYFPEEYSLSQNYPNPFNPTTTIEFELLKSRKVTLKIYNILGEEVETLLSTSLLSGSYKYEWDAAGLASGIYLYRLQAGNHVETRKMVLMK